MSHKPSLVRILQSFILFISLVLSTATVTGQTSFADTGRAANYQRSLDVQGRLNVLSLALQPGYEDLPALTYFRMARGATILSAYLTNGETGESDTLWADPYQLAGARRLESTRAMKAIDGDAYFLNFPDIATAKDLASISRRWIRDSIQAKLIRVIRDFRPDVILVARDWGAFGSRSFRWEALRQEVIAAARVSGLESAHKSLPGQGLATTPWSVRSIWIDDGTGKGKAVPITELHPVSRRSYEEIAGEAEQAYSSLRFQKRLWSRRSAERRYVMGGTGKGTTKDTPARPASLPVTKKFRILDRQIASLTGRIMASARAGTKLNPQPSLLQLTAVMDSLDFHIARSFAYSNDERRLIVDWKLGLERLRTALLGVTVHHSITETVLTQLQLSLLVIDSVTGTSSSGKSELYFPQKEWIINERHEARWPLELHKDYRLLSPSVLEYNWPIEQLGLDDAMTTQPFLVYIIHKAANREESFVYKINQPMYYAPRFTTEVLTPIVRAIPDEYVTVRLTNHSRDGLKDILHVDDSLVTSNQAGFRLTKKEESRLDTLKLQWKQELKNGTYIVPVLIGHQEVSRFGARKFDVRVDSSKRIGLLSGVSHGGASETLRRLGLEFTPLSDIVRSDTLARGFDVLVVDHRFTTFAWDSTLKSVLKEFAERGGHVVVLSQDAMSWNPTPLIDGIVLTRTTILEEESEIDADTTHALLTSPNKIGADDWNGWLFARGSNLISGPALSEAEIPVRTRVGHDPLVVVRREGRGCFTYVDLALDPQFLNIHAGAFRILANVLAY